MRRLLQSTYQFPHLHSIKNATTPANFCVDNNIANDIGTITMQIAQLRTLVGSYKRLQQLARVMAWHADARDLNANLPWDWESG
jgi:hypothetical protein